MFYEDAIAAFRSGATGRAEELSLELMSQARDGGDLSDLSAARLLYEESIEVNVQLSEERMVAVEHRNLAYVELHDGHADLAEKERLEAELSWMGPS